jgi:hypothetical protein
MNIPFKPDRIKKESRTHANPAELVFTLLTCHVTRKNCFNISLITYHQSEHVLAPAVLLNRTLTLRALFGIALDPIRSLAIVPALLQPHPGHGTNNRSMVTLNGTSETKLMRRARPARYSRYDGRQGGFGCCRWTRDGVCASRVRTIFEVRVGGYEMSNKELLEPRPRVVVLFQSGLDEWIRTDNATPFTHAPNRVFAFITDFTHNIRVPATCAILVVARQR